MCGQTLVAHQSMDDESASIGFAQADGNAKKINSTGEIKKMEGDNVHIGFKLESNFAGIQELDAEQLDSSVENSPQDEKQEDINQVSPGMKFSEINQTDRSNVSQQM